MDAVLTPAKTETRRLGEQERIFNYLHGFGSLIAVQVMHIRGRLDPEQVTEALAWLQTQHPILRAHIELHGVTFRHLPPYAYRQPYFSTEGTTEIPLRVVTDPAPDAWQDVMQHELHTPLQRGRNPRMRVVLVRPSEGSDTCQLILAQDHAIADAQSTGMASRHLMEYFADPITARMRTPLLSALPPALESNFPRKSNSGTREFVPSVRLPAKTALGQKARTHVEARHFTIEETSAIRAMAKANRATMHGVIIAAELVAIREKYGMTEMTCLSTIDLRRLCKPILPAATYGCYIDILRTKHAIREDFWSMAQEASFGLITALAKDQEMTSILKLPEWPTYRYETWPTILSAGRLDGIAVTTAGESGLARNFGAYELEEVTMAVSIDLFGPATFTIAAERQGALDLYVCYAAHALRAEDATELTNRTAAALRRIAS